MADVERLVSENFTNLSQHSTSVINLDLQNLERHVMLMYDRYSVTSSVDEARLDLFAHKQKPYNAIPPTQASLRAHAKRAAYQAGIIWGQATIARLDISSPAEWEWTMSGNTWVTCWTTFPLISSSCQELTKSSCKVGCSNRFKCFKSVIPCTAPQLHR